MSSICDDLRAAILQAAMQGKLTEQFSEDGTAEELLEQINAEKEKLIAEGKIKKQKPLAPIIEDEIPFEVPDNWKWTRLEQLSILLGGNAFKGNELLKEQKVNYVRVIRISDFNQNGIIDKNPVFIKDSEKYDSYVIKEGDILMCMTGGTVGKSCFIESLKERNLLNQRVADIRTSDKLEKRYIYNYLVSPLIQQIINESKNSTNDNISAELIRNFIIPIPPLAEQKRIVEKIDELMARIADLEKSADALASLKKSFPGDIKASLLQAAMQGKLTEQLPEDGTAEELLEQIKVEKEKLITEGKIKKQKPLAPITEAEMPFEIPKNWKWVRHNDIFEIFGGSQPPKDKFSKEKKSGYVRLYQIRDYGDHPVPVYVPMKSVTKFTIKGDILLARYGGSLGKVFLAEEGAYNVAMAKVCKLFENDNIDADYLFNFYLSPIYQNMIKTQANSRSAQGGFNKNDLDMLLFPLPPLNEQKRIINRLNKLLQNINEVKELIASE